MAIAARQQVGLGGGNRRIAYLVRVGALYLTLQCTLALLDDDVTTFFVLATILLVMGVVAVVVRRDRIASLSPISRQLLVDEGWSSWRRPATLRRKVVAIVRTKAAACYAVAVVALGVLLAANGQRPLVAFGSALVGRCLSSTGRRACVVCSFSCGGT